MSQTPSFDAGNFDPYKSLEMSRSVGGIIKSGSVTYDADYIDSSSITTGAGVYARWVYVGTTGNLAYVKYDGSTEILPNLVAGVWHPIYSKRILSSGTTIAANQLRWGS